MAHQPQRRAHDLGGAHARAEQHVDLAARSVVAGRYVPGVPAPMPLLQEVSGTSSGRLEGSTRPPQATSAAAPGRMVTSGPPWWW